MAAPRKAAIIPRSDGDSSRAFKGVSTDAEVARESDETRQLELARSDDLLVAQVPGQDLPDRLAGDAFGDRGPARDLVGLVRLHRLAAHPHEIGRAHVCTPVTSASRMP